MKKVFILIMVLFPLFCSGQYEYLKINNVQSWGYQSSSIDSVLFEVKPKGIYTEIGMYFNFSTRGCSFYSGDSLEVEMLFKLPPNAEVIDMWLWMDDTIIVADVYDKWTASQIYENIVDRRKDPAILYRYNYDIWDWYTYQYMEYTDFYMFKIFPLMTNLPRKAKITYMVRNTESLDKVQSVSLPANILALSNLSILKNRVRFFPANNMSQPVLAENPSGSFTQHTSPITGTYYETDISNLNNNDALTLTYSISNLSSIAISDYVDTVHAENFYQLQVKPGDLFNIPISKKALFLFDFIPGNTLSLSGSDLLTAVKNDILGKFDEYDSVNFMFSGFVTHQCSTSWIPADSVSITNAFNTINSSLFNSYSNLPTLLTDGIQFIQQHNDIGNIILLASSNSNGDFNQANDFIDDMNSIIGTSDIPIYIIDLNETTWPQYSIGNQYFIGNEYLYLHLCTQNSGENFSITDDNFNELLTEVISKLGGFFSNFDMYVTLENGYTYSNFDLFAQSGLAYFDQPAQKIGKYNGTGRFHIQAHGQLPSGQLLVADTLIENNIIQSSDCITRAMWAAQLIRELASQSQTNSIIHQIIVTSMAERVLSDYTAFLALEPGIGSLDPENNNEPIGAVENMPELSSGISIYPNPFTDISTVSYSLSANSRVLIEVYDVMGKRVAVLADTEQEAGSYSLVFHAEDLAPGIYFCKIAINKGDVQTIKMVKN